METAGGHDDNMFLAASPDGLGNLNRLGGAYGSVSPAVAADLAGAGFRVRLAYLGDFRGAEAAGLLAAQTLELRGSFPAWGPLRVHLAGYGTAFQANKSPEDDYRAAGAELGFRLRFADAVALSAAVRGEIRWLTADDFGVSDQDRMLLPVLRLPWQATPWLEVAAVGSGVFISSANETTAGDFRRWRGGIDATVSVGNASFTTSGWAGTISVADRRETHLGGLAEATLALGNNLALFARGEWSGPVSSGATPYYARRVGLLGLTARV
ncbi:MAG TPA: hypothetical protein VGF45_13925, partial [Polyangia bacterium]